MASSIEIDVSADIAKFKSAMDKAALEGSKLNKKLSKSFKAIGNVMKGIGALAGVAVAGGFASMAKSSINAADAIQKLGVRTGASTKFLSEMRLGLSQAAVSQGEFETALRKINKSTADAAAGLSTQTRAFGALGLSVEEFQKLNTDQKFITLSEAISKVKDPATKTQVAMDIMGRSGESLLTVMENGAEGIANYREEAIALGQSLSQDQVDAAAAANDALDKLTKSISGGFSQAILGYTDEIKVAADLTREYLPKAIGILVDAFKSLKLVVQSVVLFILDGFEALFKAAEKLPLGLGDNFKGVATFFEDASDIISVQIEDNVASMGKWTDKARETAAALKTTGTAAVKEFVPSLIKVNTKVKLTKEELKALKEEAKRVAAVIKDLEQVGKDFADNIPDNAPRKLAEAIKLVGEESLIASRRQSEFDEALKNGSIKSGKEAAAVAQELGVKYKDLSKETESVTTVMAAQWERFKSSAFNSLETFYKSGLSGTKSFSESIKTLFKDMVAGILAQITAMLASKAFNTFVKWVSGGSINLGGSSSGFSFGGGNNNNSSSDAVANAAGSVVSSQVSSYIQTAVIKPVATYVANALGITAAGTGFAATSTAVVTAEGVAAARAALLAAEAASLSAETAVLTGTGQAVNGGLSTFATASIWGAVALAADTYLNDGRVTNAFGVEAEGRYQGVKDLFDGDIGSFISSQFTSPYDALKATFGGQGTDSLGREQLGEVFKATEEGRNQAIGLDESTAFLGGFNPETIFYQTLADADFEQVSELLKDKLGVTDGDIREIGDGILRIESQGEDFGAKLGDVNTIVAATIAEVALGYTDAEQTIIGAMGNTAVKIDAAFDSIEDDSLSAKDKVIESFSKAFEVTTQQAAKMVAESGIEADRLAEIFGATSGEILTSMVGTSDGVADAMNTISVNGADAANVIRANFGRASEDISLGLASIKTNADTVRDQIANSWDGLSLGQIAPITVPVINADIQSQGGTQSQGGLSSDAAYVVAAIDRKTRAELEAMREVRNAA